MKNCPHCKNILMTKVVCKTCNGDIQIGYTFLVAIACVLLFVGVVLGVILTR